MKKYSILGLVLLLVSGVTAAFLPSKTEDKKFACNGIADNTTDAQNFTCRYDIDGQDCLTDTANPQSDLAGSSTQTAGGNTNRAATTDGSGECSPS